MKDILKKPVLVTGATGFIGSVLVRRLIESGTDVHVTVRKESDTWRITDILKDIVCHTADLTDSGSIGKVVKTIGPGAVFHCAVYGGYLAQSEVDKIIGINVQGTAHLLNVLADTGCDFFVNTGSSSEYGVKDGPMKETDPLEPVTMYGISKATATALCLAFGRSHDIPNVTIRPFSPYGPYDGASRLVSAVIRSCIDGKDPKLSNPSAVRDYVFIDDVIDAYMAAIGKYNELKGEVVNVGSGKQSSIGEVADEIIELTGADVKVRWGAVDNPRDEPKTWVADVSHARELLGWEPRHDLRDGLKKTIEWFRGVSA